jgi:hypothetical protein
MLGMVLGLLALVVVDFGPSPGNQTVALRGAPSVGNGRAVPPGDSHPKRAAAGSGETHRAASPGLARMAPSPVSPDVRAGARKAVPVTRGQELGLRFRPDESDSSYGEVLVPPATGGTETSSPALQSQFRPVQKRRKPTYEELQAETMPPEPPLPAPILPYPTIAPPPPGFGPGWPAW